jgi:hypothetical protein
METTANDAEQPIRAQAVEPRYNATLAMKKQHIATLAILLASALVAKMDII